MARDIYTISNLIQAPRRFKFIIIHDTNCQLKEYQQFKIDKNTFQSGPLRARFKITKSYNDVPYHFVCEKIGENYQTFLGRPLQYSCEKEYPDIDSTYSRYAVHICLMGNYNNMACPTNLYQQLAYRVICPMMKVYRIHKSRIFLHAEVTKNSDFNDCPGFNFRKDALFAFMNKFRMGTAS
jgi:hypothetical protein